jgi:ATP-dependent DNA helicase MPH1
VIATHLDTDHAMSSSDEYGAEGDDTEFLAAATQVEATQNVDFAASPRPTKRRRISRLPQIDGASSDVSGGSEDGYVDSPPRTASRHFGAATAPTQAEDNDQDEIEEDEDDNDGREPETDPSYYFPEENPDGEDQATKQSKYKIHIPKNGGLLPDMVFTQTQRNLDEDPAAIRGAVWKKPRPPPPPLFNAPAPANARQIPNAGIQSVPAAKPRLGGNLDAFVQRSAAPNRPRPIESDAALAKRLQAEENAQNRPVSKSQQPVVGTQHQLVDFTQDLEDLPSDAFSSSSHEQSPNKDVIEISSQMGTFQKPIQKPIGALRGPQTGLKQMNIFGQPATQAMSASQAAAKKHAWPLKEREEAVTHHKLDAEAMKTWVYPINLGTIRDYQFNIVARSLFHNTLVALPTGLGKTFIAATVMLNYYRWTTDAQIIFMAPTKPLIAQQMEACYGIAGIRRNDTVLMTGDTSPSIRAEEWLEKRAFFMTPQTVINDLQKGICDPKRIVLIVVDEAHKATGGYAYTLVATFLRRFNPSFRVLALTATPGSSVEAVQSIIDHLGIARVEVRTEQSLDIRQYTHEKQTETEVFDWSEEQNLIMDHVSKAIKPVLDKLNSQNAYWSKDPMLLTAFGLTQARKKWMMSEAGRKAPMGLKGMINTIFTVLSQIAHSISLLKFHGITPFYSSALEFQKNVESGQTKSKYASQITQHEDWVKAMGYMRTWSNSPDFIGHPKLEYLREVVLNHFLDAGEGRQGDGAPTRPTRIMVFSGFRDSTQDICRVLKRNEPMIRPHEFVGQANSKSSEGMNQKKQNEVIQDFKAGKFNTLVATSIGEEGLDIGDVDLIVCYDASASPVRMLQRIGRTGRKRVGRVVLLLMRGKEDNDYAKAQDNYAYIQKTIADDSKYNYRDDQSPRILPKEVKPEVDKRMIDIPTENTQPVDLNEKNRKRRGKGKVKAPPKKFHMPDNVRTGFVTASRMDSDAEGSEDKPAPKKKAAAKKKAPAKAKQRPVTLPPEPAQIPFLDDVLLSAEQQRELDQKYAQTSDNAQNTVIQAPDPSRLPESLRLLGAHQYVGHGRAAMAVSKAMQLVQSTDSDRVDAMKACFDEDVLKDLTGARARLVDPEIVAYVSDNELPEAPVAKAAPKVKNPRGRPAKKQNPAQKQTPARQRNNYGSDAMEGEESSPEPTPANMRIGTQGIDLGSHDTSGEEDDEEPDSELEAFVARSDDPIETFSSSLPNTQHFAGSPKKGGRLKTRKQAPIIMESDEDEDEDDEADGVSGDEDEETPKASRTIVDVDVDVDDEEVEISDVDDEPVLAAGRTKKRRAVQESDSDE